jgi:anti-sigma regulatory factor (Ser/Thr protein kinase)
MMKELSLNILDIAKNSVTAGSSLIRVTVTETATRLTVEIADDGCGMDPEFLARVTDPFTTTRTTRKVGMGIPLLKMAAEMSGGGFDIQSTVGKGTTTTAWFDPNSIDTPPMGDLTGTILTLIQGSPDMDFLFTHRIGDAEYALDTREIRQIMEGVPLDSPELLLWLGEYLRENEAELKKA